MAKTHRAISVSRSTSYAAALVTAVIAPQIILRALAVGSATVEMVVAGITTVVSVLLYIGLAAVLRAEVPRRSVHQLAGRYLFEGGAVIASAARFLGYAIIIVLGVGLATSSIQVLTPNEVPATVISAVAILVLAIPILTGVRPLLVRLTFFSGWIGLAGLVFVIVSGLIQELTGGIDYEAASEARIAAFTSGIIEASKFSFGEALVGSLFPAAMVLLISERVLVEPPRRRVDIGRLSKLFFVIVILILLQLYFVAALELPSRRLGVPALAMVVAFVGPIGLKIAAVCFIILGLSAAFAAYQQLPRMIREIAIDNLLPRRFASADITTPRRVVVAVIALLAAGISTALKSTQAVAIIFVFSMVVLTVVTCLALAARASATLRVSTEASERRVASVHRWVFRLGALLGCAVLVAIVVVKPTWGGWAAVALAVPSLMLMLMRKGLGKLGRRLAVDDLSAGRALPPRVHGLVLMNRLDEPAMRAISYARSMRLSSLEGIHVDFDPAGTRELRTMWKEASLPIQLTILGTPRGATRGPVLEHVRSLKAAHPRDIVVVFVPTLIKSGAVSRFVAHHTRARILHDLELEPHVVVATVPFAVDSLGEDND